MPPETTQTVFLFSIGNLWNIAAATGTAPAPSAINFCFSIKAKIAAAISSSDTQTISSTYFEIISKVFSPGFLTAIPSANVETLSKTSRLLFLKELYIEGAPAAWTP